MIREEREMYLLLRLERFLRRSRIPATRFGREAARDPRLVFDLRRGRRPGPRMAARIIAYLDAAEQRLGGRKWRR